MQLSRCDLACSARELRLQFRGARAIPYPRTLKTIQRFNLQTFNSCFLFRTFVDVPFCFFEALFVRLTSLRLSVDRPRFRRPPFGFRFLPRKEVIQPHLPIRLPCYDFTPVIGLALGGWLLAVTSPTLGTPNSHGVTGGVYKARERIHRGMLIRDY